MKMCFNSEQGALNSKNIPVEDSRLRRQKARSCRDYHYQFQYCSDATQKCTWNPARRAMNQCVPTVLKKQYTAKTEKCGFGGERNSCNLATPLQPFLQPMQPLVSNTQLWYYMCAIDTKVWQWLSVLV